METEGRVSLMAERDSGTKLGPRTAGCEQSELTHDCFLRYRGLTPGRRPSVSTISLGQPQRARWGPLPGYFLFAKEPGLQNQMWLCSLRAPCLQEWKGVGRGRDRPGQGPSLLFQGRLWG